MEPILVNLEGMEFLLTAESGILIQSFGRSASRTKDYVYNGAVGYDTGFVGHNPQAEYNIKGRTTAETGLAAAAPCVALTVAGKTFGNGVGTTGLDAGGIYTDTVSLDHAERAFQEITITATQKPGIS